MMPKGAGCSIVLKEVGHWFLGTGVLFSGINAEFRAGTVTAVCGPSGCGKSTLLTLLAGWEQPRSGQITRTGVNSLSWVFQNPHGVARRKAIDHVAFPLLAQGMSRRGATKAAGDLLDRFGLTDVADRPFSALSGGESQRLLLARALAVDPDVLLVDEPTAQLDRESASVVNGSLAHLGAAGGIVIVATHDPETRSMCGTELDLTLPHASVGEDAAGLELRAGSDIS